MWPPIESETIEDPSQFIEGDDAQLGGHEFIVRVRETRPTAALVARIRAIRGMSIRDIRSALTQGTPLLCAHLFLNDHDERAAELRQVIALVQDFGLTADALELEEEEVYDEHARAADFFPVSQVSEILEEWDRGLARDRELDDVPRV